MSDAPRLLFVADASAAVEALSAVREGGPVRAQLAPSADVLRDTLMATDADQGWDAVVFVPGGAVEEVELAVYVPDGLPLFVVADEVPLLLTETAAEALPASALGTLVGRLAAPADVQPWAPEAFDPEPSPEPPGPAAMAASDLLPDDAFATAPLNDPGGDVAAVDPSPTSPEVSPLPEGDRASDGGIQGPGEGAHGEGRPNPFGPLPATADAFRPFSDAVAPAPRVVDAAPDVSAPAPDVSAPAPDVSAPAPDVSAPDPRVSAPAPDVSAPAPDLADAPSDAFGAVLDDGVDCRDAFALPWEPAALHPPPEVAAPEAPADEPAPAGPVAMSEDLASLADDLPIGLYRTTPDGRILYANPALHAVLGTDAPLAALDVRTDLGYPRQAFEAEIAAEGTVRNLVVTWTRPDGARVHTRENARCLRDAAGRVIGYEGTLEDVTAEVEGRRDEQALAREHRAVAAFASAAALAADPASIQCAAAGALLDATEAEWAMLLTRGPDGAIHAAASAGALPDGVAGLVAQTPALAAHVFPDRLVAAASVIVMDAASPAAEALLAYGVGTMGSVPVQRAGRRFGALVWGRAAQAAPRPAEGRAAESLAWHVGGHLERVAASQALRDTEATLAVVAEHTPHVLYRLRYADDGPVTDFLSPAVEALTGYARPEIEARGGFRTLIDRSEASEGAGLLEGPVADADHYRAVYRIATAHGPRWVEDVARPWHDAAGRVLGLVGVVSDVTERRAREEALAEQALAALARQRALVDLSGLDGADAYGGPAAAIVAATLEASGASFWTVSASGTCAPLYAPPAHRLGGSLDPVVGHVAEHRALAIADTAADDVVAELGLEPFVRAYGLTALLVAPVRRDGRVAGLVAVHRTDGPHAWSAAEAEFAAAVADAIALALERDDRDLALAELDEARLAAEAGQAQAEAANRVKSAFLETLSQEVRMPLTSILSDADELAEEVPAPDRGAAVRIARNGRQLLSTLDAVLELSRLEAGDLTFDTQPMALAAPVRDAAAPFQGAARGKGLRLDLDLDPAVQAAVDAAALKRLVGHLVENAVGFTDEGGLHVAVEADGGEAVVRVADTGRGISAGFLPHAFGPFRQEAAAHGGAGLGLALARRLAEHLGGRIEIASEQPGGTVVTVAFPLVAAPPDPAVAPAAPADLAVGDGHADPGDLLGRPFDFTFLTALQQARPPAVAPARSPASPTPAPTDMFDFQFGRPQPSDPEPPTPAAPPAAATDAPPSVEPVLFVRPREADPRPTLPPAPTEVVEEAEVVSDGRPSVLVVEDNDDTRMLLERILRSTYAVTAVGDARSALLAMNQQRFSGLVLDINLGGKETGADVLRIARSLPDYGSVFAIALTAYALPGDRERLLESGFNAYISKPFTRASLMETLADGVSA